MIITRTPYRISFFGGGTDYPSWFQNFGKGAVLSTTINKYCYVTCRQMPPFFDVKNRIVWSKIELTQNINEIEHPSVREALKFLKIRNGIEITHKGELPAYSGMGTNSSFTVGLLNALYTLNEENPDKKKLALNAIYIDQGIIKEKVGCQDHVATSFGGLNKIEFGGKEKIKVTPIVLSPKRLRSFQDHLMLFFTRIPRLQDNIVAEQIKLTAQKNLELKAMLAMVDEGIGILQSKSSLDNFGKLLNKSWNIKRALTTKITNPKIDEIYARGLKAGALGGKLLGAGGGGFMLFFVRPELHDKVKRALKDLVYVPFEFENKGSQVIHND